MKQIELLEKRKRNEKHFLQKDGTIVAKVYSSDVHYLKNGKYEEIDNTLIENEDCYTNKSNDYKVSFNKQCKDSIMKVQKDNYYLNINLKQSNQIKINKRKNISKYISEVLYDNILDGIDIDYKTLPTKIKETIILKDKKIKKITFVANTNLQLELEHGSIKAKDGEKNVFIIEKPYMEDSNGKINNNIYYEINLSRNSYEIDLILDAEWLNKAQYPIYIDPTIINSYQTNSVYDTYIYPGDTGIDRNSLPYLKIGVEKVNNNYITNRALLKFDLPDIGTASEIINAELVLQTCYATDGNNAEKTLEVHRVTTDWTEETATWELMNNKFDERVETLQFLQRRQRIPKYELDENGNPVDVSYDINTYSQMYNDITDLVKHWYNDTPNNGIMIKANPEIYIDDNYAMVFSKNNTISEGLKPLLIITYRNQNGLESYLNYKTQNFSDGKTFLNTYNGNLVGVFNVGNTISNKLPATIDLIYNTNDVLIKTNGFKFSLNQTIKVVSIDNNQYLEYEDEDGTVHYFYQDPEINTKYLDEDGLELAIEKNNDYCYMTDKYNNKKTFTKLSNDIYYLTKIENVSLDSINIELDSNNRITKVSDGNNLPISINYLNNQTIITSPDRVTTLNYNGDNITSLVTVNGTTEFAYNSNNLISSITDVTGLKINYEYYEQKPYRIKKIEQYGLNNKLGNYFTVEYGFNSTSFTDNKGRINTLIFNSIGNLISSNTMSLNEDITNAYSISTEYGDSELYKNKLLDSTIPVKYIKNYLFNTNSEEDNQYFSAEYPSGVSINYSNEYYHSGTRSVKIQFFSIGIGTSVYNGPWKVPKGKYYTFSGYFKNDKVIKIGLKGNNNPGKFEEIEVSDDFVRREVSFYLDENSDGRIEVVILSDKEATIYVDDIQLEEGEVANNYNCIENSDFSSGLLGWEVEATKDDYTNLDEWGFPQEINVDTSEVFEVVKFNNEKNTALQINMNPIGRSSLRKTFPIKGKKGDIYDISFWMKNEGLVGNEIYVGNTVMIYFKPVGHDADYCILASPDFVPNNKWQYFSFKYSADEDYESISIVFHQGRQANKILITNLTFYKDLNTEYYNYDNKGNIISVTDTSGRNTVFNYDKNNQLIGATNPKGRNFSYEYDNVKTDRVLSAISAMGISNEVKYDSFGNPILTKISKKGTSQLDSGKYKIRNKGTDAYLKAEYNTVLVESDACSNTIWHLEKLEEEEIINIVDEWNQTVPPETVTHKYFKIIYSIMPSYFINYSNNTIWLSMQNSNNLFVLENVKNGSYHIKLKDEDKYLKSNNGTLQITSLVPDDPTFEFYFEVVDDKFIENSATYSEDGRFVKSVTNSLFNKTLYETDPTTGLVTIITNANNQTINYTYNDKKQITSVKQENKIINYGYGINNLLSKITQGTKEYNFIYDDFLNMKKVMIGNNITLITKEYEENNGNLLTTTYGNQDTISFEYDEFDRVKTIHKMDKDYYYRYDSNGNLAKILTNNLVSTYDVPPTEAENYYDSIIKYTYDSIKRIQEYVHDNFKINYIYDINDNVTNKKYYLDIINHSIENIFDKDDMLTKSIIDDQEVNYQYDGLGRLINKNINNNYNTYYDYVSLGKRTSTLVKSIQNGDNKYSYNYDKLNNITQIYYNDELQKQYYYDEYNELIKEEDYITNERIEYNYDNSGNLLTKTITNLTTNVIISIDTYQYSNNNWEDQLTKFNENSITYDEIGNPLTIGNNINMSWINGRSLNTYEDNTKNLNINYQYNVDGIRTAKIINGMETKYYLENDKIIFEKRENDQIYYLYDEIGLLGLKYNNNIYYYIKNLQGDIIGILDSNYNQIVSYEYNSWGKVLCIKDSQGNEITDSTNIGNINPFRYRGYYYDTETELYYLNSRYYNPEWCRFINSDNYVFTDTGLLGYNMYNYANNNPIIFIDPSGHGIFIGLLIGIVAVGSAVTAYGLNNKKQNKKAADEIIKVQKKYYNSVPEPSKAVKFKETLKNNVKTVKSDTKNMNAMQKLDYFIDNVKTGAKYDLKNTEEWKNTDIYYDGIIMEPQDIGNYHFGYIGRALGYSTDFLTTGAGLYQLKSGTAEILWCFTVSNCDDPRDTYFIRLGAIAYDRDN